MKMRWMAGLAAAAVTVLASATPRAPEPTLARNDDPSGYFGSGHDPASQAARSAAAMG